MRFKLFLPGITWFIISAVLLTLPGDDLPHSDFFDIPFFDKYVHLIMFLMLTSLISYPFVFLQAHKAVIKRWFTKVSIFVIIYGILMEFVQKYFVYARSFDVTDIVFDFLGSVVGLIVITVFYNKKIGPNRNRGRNQN